jgi:hypothetical protein
MVISSKDLVRRMENFETLAATQQLRPWQWEFLYALDGRTPLGELARKLGIEMPLAMDVVTFFEGQGLIEIRTMSFEEFRTRKAAEKSFAPAEEPSANGAKPAAQPAPKSAPAGSIGFKIR